MTTNAAQRERWQYLKVMIQGLIVKDLQAFIKTIHLENGWAKGNVSNVNCKNNIPDATRT